MRGSLLHIGLIVTCLGLFRLVVPPATVPVGASAPSDSCRSHFGYAHTPKGRLHVLFLFIGFEEDSTHLKNWKFNQLPDWAKGASNQIIDRDPETIGQHQNLSLWFKVMSQGQFIVTGEVFPELVRVSPRSRTDYGKINALALEQINRKYPNFDWSRFDRRENNPKWQYDNNRFNADGTTATGDGKLDYVVVIHRNDGGGFAGAGNIFGRLPKLITNYNNQPDTFSIDGSCGHSGHFMINSVKHHEKYFLHELAHNLYGSPHYFAANNAVGKKFYCNRGWGMMSDVHAVMHTMNAWEKWWLGWMDPIEVMHNGTYALGDFITQNQAIRIRIPHTDQYLWIENHQMRDPADTKLFYREESPLSEGLYMFITDKCNDCNQPEKFSVKDLRYSKLPTITNTFKPLSAEGNYDYEWLGQVTSPNGGQSHSLKKGKDNPIAGSNDFMELRFNLKEDNRIELFEGYNGGSKFNEQTGVWMEEGQMTYAFSGDVYDAFRKGDELGLSGKIPILNYPDYSRSISEQGLQPYQLNGLSIKVIDYHRKYGVYTLQIRFDDYEVRKDKRWCGRIQLNDQASDAGSDLIINSGVTLTLDKSGTINRHDQGTTTKTKGLFPDFINPTQLDILTNAKLLLQPKARMLMKEATMVLDSGANVSLQKGAELIVEKGGHLTLHRGSRLTAGVGTSITIRSGGKVTIHKGAQIDLTASTSLFRIDGDLDLIGGVKMDHNGPGKVIILDRQ